MHWQHNAYGLPLAVTALLSIGLAASAWRHRSTSGAKMFALMMLAVTGWLVGYLLELGAPALPAKVLWARVEYVNIVFIPVIWLVFALQYAGRHKWLTRQNIGRLVMVPLITLLLVWTNEAHGLIWSSVSLEDTGSFWVMSTTHGIGFWVHTAYSYILLLLGTLLFIQALIRAPHLYRRQAAALLLGALAPWIGNAVTILGVTPFPHLDLTPFAFALTGLSMAWGLFHFQLFDIVPVARDVVIESMSDGVIVLDLQDRIVDLNPAAQRIIGHSASEAIGQPMRIADCGLRIADWIVIGSRLSVAIQSEICNPQSAMIFDLHISPLYDWRGRLTGRLLVLRNITQQKQAEEELRKAKEAAEAVSVAKSEFIANVSHELRTPLNSIIGFADVLQEQYFGPLTEKQAAYVQDILESGKHLQALIDEILNLSGVEAGQVELRLSSFPIQDVITAGLNFIEEQAYQQGVHLETNIDARITSVVGDPQKIKQVLYHLLSNAVKFTPNGGKIRVAVDFVDSSPHKNGVFHPTAADKTQDGSFPPEQGALSRQPVSLQRYVRFCVEDTGVGIAPENQERIFEAFYQVNRGITDKTPGAGLGLILSRQLVEMHGGRLWVESEGLGQGSRFYFTLPINPPSSEQSVFAVSMDLSNQPVSGHRPG